MLLGLFGAQGHNLTTGGINSYEVVDTSEGLPAEGDYLKIEGRQLGVTAWLLEKAGLADPTFCFTVSKDFLTLVKARKEYTLFPTQEVHSVSVGYSRNKALVLIAIFLGIVACFLSLLVLAALATDGRPGQPAVMCLIAGVLALVNWFLYKFSEKLEVIVTLISSDRVRMSFGVKLKSTITGAKVTEEQLGKTLSILKEICQSHSKYY